MQYTLWNTARFKSRIRQAEHIGRRDRFSPQATTHDVADATADSGCRTAVGLDGRRMVVRFDLESQPVFIIEGDHARIVDEDRKTPFPIERRGRVYDRFLQ